MAGVLSDPVTSLVFRVPKRSSSKLDMDLLAQIHSKFKDSSFTTGQPDLFQVAEVYGHPEPVVPLDSTREVFLEPEIRNAGYAKTLVVDGITHCKNGGSGPCPADWEAVD